jgi:putative two-component system response regulator
MDVSSGPDDPLVRQSAVPTSWGADPLEQVRALLAEVRRHKDSPTAETRAFMDEALLALARLPEACALPERAQALMDISRYYYLDDANEPAVRTAYEAVRTAMRAGLRPLESAARQRLGVCLRSMYDFFGSMTELVQAAEIARDAGDELSEAKALNSLGNTYCDAGLCEESLEILERAAAYFESIQDNLSAWMALDNAAVAALRSGDVQRGIELAGRARKSWAGQAQTADECMWVTQSAITNCQLLIHSDRTEEALACARASLEVAERFGLSAPMGWAKLSVAISAFANGDTGTEEIECAVEQARDDAPNFRWCTLDIAIRTYEHAGQYDRALELQRELLDLCRSQKFEQVRQTWGRPSPEEATGTAMLAQLGLAVDRTLTDLVNTAITQSLRAGHDHARIFRVSRLAKLFSTALGWSDVRVQPLELAARLIDVGMMVIPDDLLRRARPLTDGERAVVAEHVRFGAEVLARARLGLLEPCRPIVLHHHERWDGAGPAAVAGAAIPIEARVLSLCDAFDALTHDRPWRRAFSLPAALRMIGDNAGSQFDSELAERFVSWVQGEFWKVDDFEAYLAVEAAESGYVQMRQRIQRLVRTSP